MQQVNTTEQLERLARQVREQARGGVEEVSRLTMAGAAPAAWAVQVVAHLGHNLYAVQQVQIGAAGTTPAPLGGGTAEAFNLSEPFLGTGGAVSAGTYAVMWRVGEKYVVLVQP